MKDNNYEFRVGDEVETVDGMSGKIISICHCERCAERGFFEPRWETPDGKYSDYITVNQANWGFPYYRRIGKYVWNHDADEEKSTKNIFEKDNEKMKEIKLTVDGKEVQLTNEQLRMLGIEVENKKNPFERVNYNEAYYFVKKDGSVSSYTNANDGIDRMLYDATNYFNDEDFAKQVALHQLLYRKLLKFAWDNGYEDGDKISRYYVAYFPKTKAFVVRTDEAFRAPWVYFSSYEGAMRAITQVAEPFMKEHPEFVW